jgi:divalent metal cation (Fe/Co/Zn/Cd) transporter
LVALFIILMMFASVGGVGLTCIRRILSPAPVEGGALVFVISLVLGLAMLLLSAYQYFVGRRTSSLALLCQAVDSRNHFFTSLLVCVGIIFSLIAKKSDNTWMLYADPVASAVIGFLILRSAVELVVQYLKGQEEEVEVSHFLGKAADKMRLRIVLSWLKEQLQMDSLSQKELEKRFDETFC